MNPVTIRIESISDLAKEVRHLQDKSGYRWWFRGHPNAHWQLLPRAWREHSREQERYLAHEFRARAGTRHSHRPSFDDYAGWLALMQHYGVPTRLLDWTRAPVVAAFFAVHPAIRKVKAAIEDACVWAIAPGPLNKSQGFEPLLYTLNAGELHELLRPAFKPTSCREVVVAAVPFESDIRMQVQQGVFTVHATGTPLDSIPGSDTWLRRFLIPVSAVSTLADDVEALGLGLADIFPDLSSLAEELRMRHQVARDGDITV